MSAINIAEGAVGFGEMMNDNAMVMLVSMWNGRHHQTLGTLFCCFLILLEFK